MTIDRSKLRELAMAATKGPWCNRRADLVNAADLYPVAELYNMPTRSSGDNYANAAYIAAAHPGAMIELLDERDGITSYLRSAIASFDADPADSDHQEGYLEALQEVLRVVTSGGPYPAPKKRPKLTVIK